MQLMIRRGKGLSMLLAGRWRLSVIGQLLLGGGNWHARQLVEQ